MVAELLTHMTLLLQRHVRNAEPAWDCFDPQNPKLIAVVSRAIPFGAGRAKVLLRVSSTLWMRNYSSC